MTLVDVKYSVTFDAALSITLNKSIHYFFYRVSYVRWGILVRSQGLGCTAQVSLVLPQIKHLLELAISSK